MTLEEFNEWYWYDSTTGLIFYRKKRTNSNRLDKPAGTINNCGYWILKFNSKMYTHHRLAWFIHKGEWPCHGIDHINGDRADNRIDNLRDVPRFVNMSNQYKHRSGKLVGCSFDKRRAQWKAKITINKKEMWLGYHPTEAAAHSAYVQAHNKYRKD